MWKFFEHLFARDDRTADDDDLRRDILRRQKEIQQRLHLLEIESKIQGQQFARERRMRPRNSHGD